MADAATQVTTRRLVLVGGGRAHLHLLREWARRPVPGVELVVVAPSTEQWYSGMVPGYLEGRYDVDELRIDLGALVRCAGARLVVASDQRVSSAERIVVAGTERLAFDLCSLDAAPGLAGGEFPGVREHALGLRPWHRARQLRDRVDALLTRTGPPLTIAVVGAGAAGLEVAFALESRLRGSERGGRVALVDASREPLAGEPGRLRRRTHALLRARGIGLVLGGGVVRVAAGALTLDTGATLPADLIVWATGVAPPPLLAASDLPLDDAGYLRVDRKQRVTGDAPVWGAGDCVPVRGNSPLSRSRVDTMWESEMLLHNLRAALGKGRARRYRPRRESLTLLDTCDGCALARRGLFQGHGRWARWLKERIDRRFVAAFAATCDETDAPAS